MGGNLSPISPTRAHKGMGRVIKAYLNERIDEPTFGELSGYVTDIYFPFPPGEEPRSRLTRALTAIGNLALKGERFERRVSQIPDQSWCQPSKPPPLAPAGAWARGGRRVIRLGLFAGSRKAWSRLDRLVG
ncbi:MAG: hypothetical protein LBF58_07150 [Deltaproteobacteria bacterium]|nr:hypothetical protein [Deltaproteobacteria bacterium]